MIPLPLNAAQERASTLPIFMASLRHDRFWIAISAIITLCATAAAALLIQPQFKAESSLLVLLGSEYTYRSVAGENINVTGALNREQILRTEIEILQEENLHRDVVRKIGPAVLYPQLFQKAGWLGSVNLQLENLTDSFRGLADVPVPQRAPGDPVEVALLKLDKNLELQAVKDGNGIELSFTHEVPEIAARVLTLLEEGYLRRRRELYLNAQGELVSHEVDNIKTQLEAADATLARFKQDKGISDYITRRTILLQQQGALETDLRLARNTIDQDTARMGQLEQQLRSFPGAYMTLQNPLLLQVQQDKAKFAIDLQAARAQAALDASHLKEISASLAMINNDEQLLDQLTRARDILADDFKAASKVRDEREVTESVELNRKENVRVLQEPRPPLLPLPTRMLIVSAGAVLSIIIACMVALLLHFLRRVYLIPEAVENDTGLRVLICIPDSRKFDRRRVMLRPWA